MPAPNVRQKVALSATVIVIVVAVAGAWALQTFGQGVGYEITVTRDGEVAKVFDLDELKSLPTRKVVMQDQEQEGPPLLALLNDAGIRSFESVKVVGMGVRDDGVIVLAASQVDDDVLLDIALRGTTKLCGPDIEWGDRVRDVQRIEVQ